jgi:TetR/AcrR family transcriptional regulator
MPPAAKKKKKATGKEHNPVRTRGRILAVATEEFSRRGYDGARVDEIMRRSKVSKNLVYHYFDSKEKLFVAVLDAAYGRMRARLETLSLDMATPVESIRTLIRALFRYWSEAPDFIGLLASENFHKGRHLKQIKAISEGYPMLMSEIRKLLVAGHRRGLFRAEIEPVYLYISISALAYHYLSNRYTLSVLFSRDFAVDDESAAWVAHIEAFVLGFLLNRERLPD